VPTPARGREGRSSLPGPPRSNVEGDAAEKTLAVALRGGLLKAAAAPEEIWRNFEEDQGCSAKADLDGCELQCRRAFHVPDGALGPVYAAVRTVLGSPDERLLWHGTSWQSLPNILSSGFNRAYAGRHGTKYGNGTYFSSDPLYALRFCDKGNGPRALLLARVLVGRYARGAPDLIEPPVLEGSDGEVLDVAAAPAGSRRYDSTVDNCEKPKIFCVFRDFQALPVALFAMD